MTRAIVFDMGGVLIGLDRESCVRAFHGIGFDKIDQMLDAYHQKGYFYQMESGEISAEEFCEICRRDSNPGTTAEDVRRCFLSFITTIDEYKFDLIRELGGKGYRLYMLSNNNPIVVPIVEDMFQAHGMSLYTTFEKLFFSYTMHMAKPEPEIYRAALEGIGLPPEEILFIDDNKANTDTAESLGIRSILYTPGEDLREAILKSICC